MSWCCECRRCVGSGGPVAGALDEALALIGPRRAPFAGLSLDRPRLMGIVNVTPDSFSDGGAFIDPAAAIAHGHTLRAAGADILDVGGESTRPGADAVPAEDADGSIAHVIDLVGRLPVLVLSARSELPFSHQQPANITIIRVDSAGDALRGRSTAPQTISAGT